MRTLLSSKSRYLRNFAEVVYNNYKQSRYGLANCSSDLDPSLAFIRKDLLDWQSIDDSGALSNVAMRIWFPVNYEKNPLIAGSSGYYYSSQNITPVPRGGTAQFLTEDGQTVLEVNAGGCITRINLNPVINMSGSTTEDNFVYVQSVSSTIWTIIHNLGYKPVVETKDSDGVTIEGIVSYLNNTTLTITFSEPVSGTAYLS